MSSMRNAVQRRPHRERAQPLERRRLGLLEKHKDYSLRAQDHNKKKAQLKSLREKAASRNEDEFYFGMLSRQGPGQKATAASIKKWDGTVRPTTDRNDDNGLGRGKSLSVEAARLLKTQDLGYVRTMRQVARKQVERLEEKVVLTKGFDRLGEESEGEQEEMGSDEEGYGNFDNSLKSPPPRKIIFLDKDEERQQAMRSTTTTATTTSYKDDAASGAAKPEAEVKAKVAATKKEKSMQAAELWRLRRKRDNERKKLSVLTEAEHGLELERARMAKTATSAGVTRRGKKLTVRKRKR